MPSRLRDHLTYANAVATICLFVVLGGGAYAASTLPNNSVGTEQIQRDGVTKPDVARDAIGPAELRTGSVQSLDVKDGSLRCQDFKKNVSACQAGTAGSTGPQGPMGPVGPVGPQGAAGAGPSGLTTTTAHRHNETIELSCDPPQPAQASGPDAQYQSCSAAETATAPCDLGEVASGGSSESSSNQSQSTSNGYFSQSITVKDDRPNPTSGTPSGWAADFKVSSYVINYSGPPTQPTDPTVSVYVVCAS